MVVEAAAAAVAVEIGIAVAVAGIGTVGIAGLEIVGTLKTVDIVRIVASQTLNEIEETTKKNTEFSAFYCD